MWGASTTRAESASENETSSADGCSAERTRHQSIAGAIKGLFRSAVTAVTRRNEDEEPPPEKRRKGETEGTFQQFSRTVARRFNVRAAFKGRAAIMQRDRIPEEIFAAATCYQQSAFDQLSQFNDDPGFIEDYSGSFDEPLNYLSLDL